MNNFLLIKPQFKGFITSFLFFLLFIVSSQSFGQTADAEKNFAQCKACHTIGGGKLVGPDLKGVTDRHSEDWLIKFIQNSQALIQAGDKQAVKVFEANFKIPMPAHKFTDDQVKDILLYIKAGGKVAETAQTAKEKPATTQTQTKIPAQDLAMDFVQEQREGHHNLIITAIIMTILMLLSIVDLVATHLLKAKWIHYIIILSALWVGGELIFEEATGLGRQQYYQPDQPIWFSHKVHAGQNQIDCEYCHFTVERSMYAGIPPAEVCMNCHSQVKKGRITGTKEIDKIYAAIKDKKPIQWIKVYNLPDFVFFSHEQHVKVGKLECKTCHGDVAKMDQIADVKELRMGWCLGCHRSHKVQFTNNKFYTQYKKLHEELKAGIIKDVTVKMVGGEDCQKCHY